MRTKKFFCTALIALSCAFLFGQSTIVVRTFHAGDSVMLRWAPTSYTLWQQGNANGYRITRFGMNEYFDLSGQDLTGKGTVIAEIVKPLPKADTTWNELARINPSSQFVFSALYTPGKFPTDQKQREQQQNLTYGFCMKICDDNPAVAKAAGLFFVDHTAQKGEQYIYRIELLSHASYAGTAGADEKQSVLPAVGKPSAQFRNRCMRLTFDVTETRAHYSGYIIERSEDSIHFSRINQSLLSFVRSQYETEKHELSYEDSIPENDRTYWFRVRGYSYFGIEGPPSPAVHGKGREEWNAYPQPDTCYSPDNKRGVIRWSIPALTGRQELKGVIVFRSDRVNGIYRALTPGPLRGNSFTDTAAQFTNYYMLAAISTENDTAFSFPFLLQLQDNDPPSVPIHVSGAIDTNGIVKLKWEAFASPDLKGYRVFRCNTLKEEFVEVTDSVIHTTTFIDTITLHTLTRDVFYSVRSVDRVWNNSAFSIPAHLERPDKIAPVVPLVKAIYHTDSAIVLRWINSSSDDVMNVELHRQSSGMDTVLLRSTGSDTISLFTDYTAEPGTIYTYRLSVTDSSGNNSVLVFPGIIYSPRVRPSLQGLTATPDLEKRTITLKWELPSAALDRIIIYKAKEGEPLRSFKTLAGNSSSYTDSQLYPGNIYIYKVKAILKDGSETVLSEVRVVF